MEKLMFACEVARVRFTVPAIERGVSGVYFDGKPYAPCVESVIARAPYRLRKAIERSTGFWGSDLSDVMRLDLNRARDGAARGTVFARALWRERDCFLDGYGHGLLPATYLRADTAGYRVTARCGAVAITVAARWAEYKIAAARVSGALPVFMYD